MIFLINLNDSKYIYGIWFVFCYGLRLVWLASVEFLAREASFFNGLIIEIWEATPPRASFRLLISEELRHVIIKLGQKTNAGHKTIL